MKLLILTEGGASTGMGHVSRCQAIAQALREFNPENQVRSVIASESKSASWIPKELNPVIKDWRLHCGVFEPMIRRADAVLVDSYHASLELLKKISSWNKRIFFIDDFNRLPYPAGTVIVPAPYFSKMHFNKRKEVTYLGGRDFVILRKPFWKESRIEIRSAVKNILLTLGATANPALVTQITDAAGLTNAQIHGVVPDASAYKKKAGIKFYQKLDAQKMKSLMSDVDFAISAGGQTLYELASCGVPTAAFELASNQKGNIEILTQAGAILPTCKSGDSDFLKKLCIQIDRLADPKLRKKLSLAGQKFVPRTGALKIAETILKSRRRDDFKIRAVRKNDCRKIWLWRNHPVTRLSSNSQDIIPYKIHQQWFESQMRSKDSLIQIAQITNGKALGQIRFKKENLRSASVHINLNPSMLGKGFGTPLLIQSTEKYFAKCRNIDIIEAEVLQSNDVSNRTFQAAGFLLTGLRVKNGRRLLIYKLRRNDV